MINEERKSSVKEGRKEGRPMPINCKQKLIKKITSEEKEGLKEGKTFVRTSERKR